MKHLKSNYDTIVIGGGQAGLATGYYLKQQGREFVILDANERVGDCWRQRWDSLELFTAAKYDSLPGMAFPAPDSHYPSKDEMADYLETYAQTLNLPVRLGVHVQGVWREGKTYIVQSDEQQLMARNVVIATGTYATPHIPAWASELAPSIQQLHSSEYLNQQQLQDGSVLVVGAGSSGTQIALETGQDRRVWLAGRYTGYIPRFFLGIDVFGLLIRTIFYFSLDTFIGRKIAKKMKSQGAPVVDIRESEVEAAGISRVPRVTGVKQGKPALENNQVIDPRVIIWATGYHNNYQWIDLPVFNEHGMPRHHRGVVESEPGLYFIGLPFQYRGKSPLLCGVGADAQYLVEKIALRSANDESATEARALPSGSPHMA